MMYILFPDYTLVGRSVLISEDFILLDSGKKENLL